MTDCVTTKKYWDCECKNNYIHPKSEKKCHVCGAIVEEQPDSRIHEVLQFGFQL